LCPAPCKFLMNGNTAFPPACRSPDTNYSVELTYLAASNGITSMEYSKIIAVTGIPGLQEMISSKNDGAIVRSLEDKSTRFVSSRIHHFSHLESIEIYTTRDNVNLVEIFQAMEKSGSGFPDEKDAKAVKAFFEKIYPELDFERVYHSDMKKMIKWFQQLRSNNVEIKLSEPEETPEEETPPAPPEKEKVKEPKEKAKAPAKAKAEKEEKKESTASAKKEKEPAKKTATKKK